MAEYAKGYASRTAWMHQSGVELVRAAVVSQAVTDYVDACKTIVALSGEVTGRNISRYRDGKIRRYMTNYRRLKMTMNPDEYIMENFYNLSIQAQQRVDEITRFFNSQTFLMYCDGATGQKVLEAANAWMREWAEDKHGNQWRLSYTPVEGVSNVRIIKGLPPKQIHPKRRK